MKSPARRARRPARGKGAPAAADDSPASGGEKVRSLTRGLELLEMIAQRGSPVSVTEIMAQMGIPRTSAYEIVRTLKRRGYLARAEATGTYSLGRQVYELGLAYQAESQLLREAAVAARRLRDETGETVQLSVLDEHGANLVMLREEGGNGVRIAARVGNRSPINWSASGCLLVSDWSDEELRRKIGPTIRPSPTGRAPMDIEALIRDVRRFRQQGFGFKLGHTHDHVAMIAAPVSDGRGRCVAAFTIAAYELGLTEKRKALLIDAAMRAADELSARLRGG
jgi:DNA-binding IclR family transcriptional regulator